MKRVAIGLLLAAAALPASATAAQISVGRNVQVSAANPNLRHWEMVLAGDPQDAKRFLACSIFNPPRPADYLWQTICYLSTDGGNSWSQTLRTNTIDSGDPAVAFGLNGIAYYSDLHDIVDEHGKTRGRTYMWVSHDGGKTWDKPQMLRGSDREFISVDMTQGPYRGRVYVNGAMITLSIDDPERKDLNSFTNGFGVLVSDDGKKPFYLKTLLDPADSHYVFAQGNGVVMPDGTYAVIFPDDVNRHAWPAPGQPNFALKFTSSSDGGMTFRKVVTIATPVIPMQGTGFGIPPVLAVDASNGPFRNRLYAGWGQQMGSEVNLVVSHSTDRGKTWSAPVIVNDDLPRESGKGLTNHHMMLAVNKNGVLGVSWYDRREDPNDLGSRERFTASFDGGDTFVSSVRVAEKPSSFYDRPESSLYAETAGGGDREQWQTGNPMVTTIGYQTRYDVEMGDTVGLVADPTGVFHALWADNRSGLGQLWTAPIDVSGRAYVNGSADLASMRDITNRITIDFANAQVDTSSGTVTADAYLANTSNRTIRGPVKARLMNLESKMGIVSLVNSNNDLHMRGAVLDFSSLLPASGLAPNQRSAPKHLRFHISGLRSEKGSITADSLADFVVFTSRVYTGN